MATQTGSPGAPLSGTRPPLRLRDVGRFWTFARPSWAMGLGGLICALIGTGLASLTPLVGKVVIDFVIQKGSLARLEATLRSFHLQFLSPLLARIFGSVNLFVVMLLVGGVVVSLVAMGRQLFILRFQQETGFRAQTTLFDRLLRFPVPFFKSKASGYLLSRVADDVGSIPGLFAASIPSLAVSAVRLAVGLTVIAALNPKLTLILLATLPPALIVNRRLRIRLRDISREEREAQSGITRDMQETLSALEVVKAFSAEEREAKRISSSLRSLIGLRITSALTGLLSSSSTSGLQLLSMLAVMWVGVKDTMAGHMTVGDYVAFMAYGAFFSGPMSQILLFRTYLQPTLASLERIKELLELAPEDEGTEDLRDLPRAAGEVAVSGVSFTYEGGAQALEKVSLEAHPGEVVALVGPSGAGKTTLVNLLLRFFLPSSGTVSIDGHDLRRVSPRWVRDQIAIVAQDVFLFSDTVEKNIRYGRPSATDEEVRQAAARACILEDIERLPSGWQTRVGERGACLSLGQRQRIAIARAYLKDPPILILDEPTSSLDVDTEQLVKRALAELVRGRTTIMVSHRISLTEMADRVYRLEQGKLAAVTAAAGAPCPAA